MIMYMIYLQIRILSMTKNIYIEILLTLFMSTFFDNDNYYNILYVMQSRKLTTQRKQYNIQYILLCIIGTY